MIDNNLSSVEASVNEASNYAAYTLRTSLEFAVGKKGFSGTVNAVVSTAVGILGQLMAAGAIVSWQNLVVELNNDVLTLDVELAPIMPINFVLTTIHLVSTNISVSV